MFFTRIKELADHAETQGNQECAEFLSLLVATYGDIPDVAELQDDCQSPEQAMEAGQYYLGVYLTHMVASSLGFNALGKHKREAMTQLGHYAKTILDTYDNNLYILAQYLLKYAARIHGERVAVESTKKRRAPRKPKLQVVPADG